jgi:hypothetical protein
MREGFIPSPGDRRREAHDVHFLIISSSSNPPPTNELADLNLSFDQQDASNTYQTKRQRRVETVPLILSTKQRFGRQREWLGEEDSGRQGR